LPNFIVTIVDVQRLWFLGRWLSLGRLRFAVRVKEFESGAQPALFFNRESPSLFDYLL
jgi:hypothetical protein